jgi:solute carrier family 10 (sodium/bile acid cotransporter), member 7
MLKWLTTIRFDAFLLALVTTVALAALLPAHGDAAEAVSDAAKIAIALLFFLYGARLSPQQACTVYVNGASTCWCWRPRL